MIATSSWFAARIARLLLSPHFFLLVLALLSSGTAAEIADPLRTHAHLPPSPAFGVAGTDTLPAPCALLPAGTVYGVHEVVDQALCRNPQTREAWAAAQLQAAQLGLAQAEFLPSVDGRLAVSHQRSASQRVNTRSAALSLSWLLFDFGARDAALASARQLLRAASATYDASVHTVFLDAVNNYYQTQAARATVAATLEAERASRESLAAAELRYQVGVATPADRLQAQTALSQTTLTRLRAEGAVRNAYGRLAQVMGLDADQPLLLEEVPTAMPAALPMAAFDRDVANLIAEARQQRPDLQAAEASVQAAESGIAQARAAGWPKLTLGGGPSWQSVGSLSTPGNSLGLTLDIPIFSGFNHTYNIRAAQARRDSQSARRDSLRQLVAVEVWEAYQNLQTAGQTVRTSADLLRSAEQSERVALGRYKAGVGNILDVLNAQSALANARLQRIQSMLDWQVSRAALAKAVGTLDNRLFDDDQKARRP